MNAISSMLASNFMVIYLLGMSFVVMLAVIFCLSIRYYMKAKDLVPYMHKIKELVEKISELQHKVEDVETQLKEKLAEVTHAEKLIQQGKDAEEWLKTHKEEIETTQKILEKVRAEMEVAEVQKTDLDRQLSERQKKLIEQEEKAVEAEGKVKEAEKSIEDIRKENAELSTRVPALRAERDSLAKQIEAQKSAATELARQIQEQNDLLNKLKGEVERLTGMIAAKKAELDALMQQQETTAHEVARLKGEEAVARKFIAERDAARNDEKEKWGSLETPVVDEKNIRDYGDEFTDENQWLKTLNKNLRDKGFVFDERAIRAFHTGLKCAEKVPLVVLAGISGTGKSLLPELYSAALGANFLSVPVQPRWDSPQDLFGFYNYMEGRYKATELARLLWQFDIYNNAVASKTYGVKCLPLNLVLLDEMNLARVEYYFSDLLSKLETRNGLDYANPLQRAKAEIELECNATEKPRHLFVSPSTLFVGTMNEDESTQTLSDKVIDRSNVLRFGRPKILTDAQGKRVPPDKSGFLDLYKDSVSITEVDWNSWKKDMEEEEGSAALKFLHDVVTPVVEKLDVVYRSYGFRVDNAMKTYVANYPGSYKEAVADQIEMKILPKLNGVELQADGFSDVKDAIVEAIGKTGDNKLMDAFEKACPVNGTFFKWRGVMR